jgi:hypothetical protein
MVVWAYSILSKAGVIIGSTLDKAFARLQSRQAKELMRFSSAPRLIPRYNL